MNSLNHNVSEAVARPRPLFASSWGALFKLIQQGFEARSGEREELLENTLNQQAASAD